MTKPKQFEEDGLSWQQKKKLREKAMMSLHQGGLPLNKICQLYGISRVHFLRLRKKHGLTKQN